MCPSRTKPVLPLVLAVCLCGVMSRPAPAASAARTGKNSVFKIYVTYQREDYAAPWQGGRPASGTGSGFMIGRKRILTNAHLVSDARFLEVQKDGSPTRYRGRVLHVGLDCDLAVLTVDDDDFFADTRPLAFARGLPDLNDEVMVLGYPMGGTRLSVTRGVVSRIDYTTYLHSGVDNHLVLQVDAAINAGNSGGPILYKGRVVGLAFQGLSWAENIGYAIPLPVVRHFLDDIEDGEYHGYPELGVATMEMRNPALRRGLGLPEGESGVVVTYVDPFGSAKDRILCGDVLLSIDRHPIKDDGSIAFDGGSVPFTEFIERRQWGESVLFGIWRDGAVFSLPVDLDNPEDPFVYRNSYDRRPEYFIVGGLVFSPLSREYLRTVESKLSDANAQQLFYYSSYAKVDGLHEGCDEFVVLIRRLPHPVNTYAEKFVYGVLEEANGIPVRGLADVKKAMLKPDRGFHVFRFAGMDDLLVLDASAAGAAESELLGRYGVSGAEHLGDTR